MSDPTKQITPTEVSHGDASYPLRVLSGVQPTGNLHLGNYLGAIRNFVDLQKTHQCLYCVVDMHAITVWQDPAELGRNTREVAAAFIAAGVDPKNHIIFNQSQVPEHSELAWVLNCVSRIGWLNRMTQFKEKAGKQRENASVGLYIYPNLMAADILLYKATHVPVGDDQKQHLELARDIAQKFNHDFSGANETAGGAGFFPLPEPIIQGPATRVMSLRDGLAKMSKSDPSDLSRISLSDSPDDIAKKIRKAKTDPDDLPMDLAGLEGRPEAANLLGIFAALSEQSIEQTINQFSGQQFSALKNALTEVAVERLSPITMEMQRLKANPDHVDAILQDGSLRAREIAYPIMQEVRERVGFLGANRKSGLAASSL